MILTVLNILLSTTITVQKKTKNSERIVALVTTQHRVLMAMLWRRTGFNADRDPAFNLSADPRSQTNADRRGSGSWSEGT